MALPDPNAKRHSFLDMAAAASGLLAVGFVDRWSGWDMSLYLFYAPPILYAAWYCDRRFALALGIFSGAVWAVANLVDHPYESHQAYLWAAFSRGIYFILITVGALAVRNWQAEVRTRILALQRTRQLEHEILQVSEREQMKLGRDLHDGLCQSLAAIDCAAACLHDDLSEQSLPQVKEIQVLRSMLKKTLTEARSLARGAFPVQMSEAGLSSALGELVSMLHQLYGIPIDAQIEDNLSIENPEVGMHLYRFVQEALSNALRHSQATLIRLRVLCAGETLSIEVIDNGTGFDPAGIGGGGMGLHSMQYRVEKLGGELSIEPGEGGGTIVRCVARRDATAGHPLACVDGDPVAAV